MLHKLKNATFTRFFAILLLSELLIVFIAWLLLNVGIYSWIHHKAQDMIAVAEAAQKSEDWSRLDEITKGASPTDPVVQHYQQIIIKLNKQFFPQNEGDISAIGIVDGQEVVLVSNDPSPYEIFEPADPFEKEAFTEGRLTFYPLPYTDNTGSTLSAFAPVLKNGKVIALIDAEFDASSLQSFRQIVHTAYWWSILPAFLVSLLVAFFLAVRFVEPMEFLRQVQEAKQASVTPSQEPHDYRWQSLTPREKEVAFCVGQGLRNKEIAQKLSVTEDTVKKHLKKVFDKLDINNRTALGLIAVSKGSLDRTDSDITQKGNAL